VLTAPVLSFTAEEAWQALPEALRGDAESVFDLAFPHHATIDHAALATWELLKSLRAQVASAEGLREALVVSQVTALGVSGNGEAMVAVVPAAGEKCERCWKYLPLGTDVEHPTLCAPCAGIVRSL